MKKEVVRDYKMPDSELEAKCKQNISNMRRDEAEFKTRNITEANDIAPFEKETDNFSNLPTDIELLGLQMDATNIKNITAIDLRNKINVVMNGVGRKFGTHSAKYARFGVKNLSKLNDDELLKCGKRVARVATSYLKDLASVGITSATVGELTGVVNDFDNQLHDQADAINDRDIAAEQRVEAGNALYAKLMIFANTGKNIWENTSEAKYNDYVIIDTPPANPDAGGTNPPTGPTTPVPTI